MDSFELFRIKSMWRDYYAPLIMASVVMVGSLRELEKNVVGRLFHGEYYGTQDHGLVDLPIGGRSFTWMNKAGTKLSKLDRFLISEDVTIRLPDVRITALDSYGANSSFCTLIQRSNKPYGNPDLSPSISLCGTCRSLLPGRQILDGQVILDEIILRVLDRFGFGINGALGLKACLNSSMSFYYLINGLHNVLRKAGCGHLYSDFGKDYLGLGEGLLFFTRYPLSREFLECGFSNEETKRAVWDYGGDRASGPNGFTFKFFKTSWEIIQPYVVRFITLIGCQYEIVGKLLANRLSRVIGSCVNVEQSALINVPDVDIADMAKVLGCGVSKLPMMYLATNAMDGLGIGSIYALNASLLFKWIWQFRCSPNDLWVKVIKEIHEIDGGIGRGRLVKSSQSPEFYCAIGFPHLSIERIHLLSACYRSVGDGNNIIFWDETLCGDRPLKEWFHRVYALDGNK
ncbi:hypothetical protein Tco_0829171 [Tanacetum coccineum]